jgi:hypothetical protein
MNTFQRLIKEEIKCDICVGETMIGLYGGGWDNDRLICGDKDCQAEIEFPTSTECEGQE